MNFQDFPNNQKGYRFLSRDLKEVFYKHNRNSEYLNGFLIMLIWPISFSQLSTYWGPQFTSSPVILYIIQSNAGALNISEVHN